MPTRPALLLALLLALGGCGSETPDPTAPSPVATATPESSQPPGTPTPTPTSEPVLSLVATVAPIADIVAQVGGERVTVSSLVPVGADAHTHEPQPRDVATVEEADAFIGVGLGLNDAAVRIAEANLRAGAPLVLLGEEAVSGDDLLEDLSTAHSHGGNAHSHDRNPHLWTSVRLVGQMADHVAGVLGELDPEAAGQYIVNAEAFQSELAALDQAIGEAVASVPEEERVLVTYHDAWEYFARDHGLRAVAAVQPSDFAEPSAADVRAIIDQIRAEGVPAIFGAEEFASDVVATIAEETQARYVGDLADDALPGEPGDPEHTYVGLMARNARLIVEALGGTTSALADFPG